MDPRILASLIAVVGVLLSAVLAFVVSRRQVTAALDTARLQSQTVFLGKLYEARLKVYPELYELLGDLGKIITTGVTTEDVQATWDAIRTWDRQNALYLSPLSVQRMISFRKVVTRLLKFSPEQLSKMKQKKGLLPTLIDMQMCLKTELGMLHAESFHNPTRLESLRQAVERASTVMQMKTKANEQNQATRQSGRLILDFRRDDTYG
jgi:hypothetical protein